MSQHHTRSMSQHSTDYKNKLKFSKNTIGQLSERQSHNDVSADLHEQSEFLSNVNPMAAEQSPQNLIDRMKSPHIRSLFLDLLNQDFETPKKVIPPNKKKPVQEKMSPSSQFMKKHVAQQHASYLVSEQSLMKGTLKSQLQPRGGQKKNHKSTKTQCYSPNSVFKRTQTELTDEKEVNPKLTSHPTSKHTKKGKDQFFLKRTFCYCIRKATPPDPIVERLWGYNKTKTEKLEKLKQERIQEEKAIAHGRPKVNAMSMKLVQQHYEKNSGNEDLLEYMQLLMKRDKQCQTDFGDEVALKKLPSHSKNGKCVFQHFLQVDDNQSKEKQKGTQTEKSFCQDKQFKHKESHEFCEESGIKNDEETQIKTEHANEVEKTEKKKMESCAFLYIPIQERYKFDLERRLKKIEKQRKVLQDNEDEIVNFSSKNAGIQIGIKLFEVKIAANEMEKHFRQFYDEKQNQMKKKKEFYLKQKIKQNQTEISKATFKPEIDKMSKKIANRMNKEQGNLKAEERLMIYSQVKKEKIELMKELQVPMFIPKISSKSKKKIVSTMQSVISKNQSDDENNFEQEESDSHQ